MTHSFDSLPNLVNKLCEEITALKSIILATTANFHPPGDEWFTAKQLCDYLPNKPKLSTIYSYTRANTIPFHKDAGEKNLRFLKGEIDDWLKRGKKKTSTDIEAEADEFLSSRKRKGVRHA